MCDVRLGDCLLPLDLVRTLCSVRLSTQRACQQHICRYREPHLFEFVCQLLQGTGRKQGEGYLYMPLKKSDLIKGQSSLSNFFSGGGLVHVKQGSESHSPQQRSRKTQAAREIPSTPSPQKRKALKPIEELQDKVSDLVSCST